MNIGEIRRQRICDRNHWCIRLPHGHWNSLSFKISYVVRSIYFLLFYCWFKTCQRVIIGVLYLRVHLLFPGGSCCHFLLFTLQTDFGTELPQNWLSTHKYIQSLFFTALLHLHSNKRAWVVPLQLVEASYGPVARFGAVCVSLCTFDGNQHPIRPHYRLDLAGPSIAQKDGGEAFYG